MVLNVTDCTNATQGGMKDKCDRRHWLTLERLTIYPIALFGSEVLAALIFFILYPHLQNVDPGLPFSSDFRVFWGASHLALHGHAADAYNIGKLFDALRLADPALIRPRAWFNWFYPPTFLLAVLPLALLPYLMSYALFVLGTLAGHRQRPSRAGGVAGRLGRCCGLVQAPTAVSEGFRACDLQPADQPPHVRLRPDLACLAHGMAGEPRHTKRLATGRKRVAARSVDFSDGYRRIGQRVFTST